MIQYIQSILDNRKFKKFILITKVDFLVRYL